MIKFRDDFPASIAVFLVALPLCLGIALASDVPLMAGIMAGVIGGIVVGTLSGSHTSVSGPAAGLIAIVLNQLELLGSFEAFLLAVLLGGVIQIALGLLRAGVIAYYFPSSVISGLLSAIGLILILKQIPHAVGYDEDAEGDMSFMQDDGFNTISELWHMFASFSVTAVVVSVVGLLLMVLWNRSRLQRGPIPAALVAVVVGTLINELVRWWAPEWALAASHRVELNTNDGKSFAELFAYPDFSAIGNPKIYLAAVTIAIVASLETLLNIEAVDRLDTEKRVSPPNRELIAQGVGNVCAGLVGALPVTSVIVRSSANVYTGAKTKSSTIMHGFWLGMTVFLIPGLLEKIPLAALAAVLIYTGTKLANPTVFRNQFAKGWNQFVPFLVTILAILFSDLLTGILIGLGVGIIFILRSMERTPFLNQQDNPVVGNVVRLQFGQTLTFWNRSRVLQALENVPDGSHVVLDASKTQYVDPDILDLIRTFRDETAEHRNLQVSLVGFRRKYELEDQKHYIDVVTQQRQHELTPLETLQLLQDGNQRFLMGKMLERDWSHQRNQTSQSQHPLAALVGCIDSRVPAELVFDLGIGDMLSIRVAGNVVSEDILGSLEYAAELDSVNLIVVLGHTKCGAVAAACENTQLGHVTGLMAKIRPIVDVVRNEEPDLTPTDPEFVDKVARRNAESVIHEIVKRSDVIQQHIDRGELDVVGAIYDIQSGHVEFFGDLVDHAVVESTA